MMNPDYITEGVFLILRIPLLCPAMSHLASKVRPASSLTDESSWQAQDETQFFYFVLEKNLPFSRFP